MIGSRTSSASVTARLRASRVLGCECDAARLAEQLARLEPFAVECAVDDRHVGGVAAQAAPWIQQSSEVDRDPNLGTACREARERRLGDPVRDRSRVADREARRVGAGRRARGGHRLLGPGEQRSAALIERDAARRQLNAVGVAVHEPGADALLELPDLSAQRLLGRA
jgi:hypothetical protein